MESIIIISSFILSAFITFSLALYVAIKVRKPGYLGYILLMLSMSFYSFGYAIELSSSTVEGVFNALKIEYIGIAFLPVFWVIFAVDYTGIGQKRLKPIYPVFFIFSFTTLFFVFSNEYHHLYYKSIRLNEISQLSIAVLDKGPYYWVQKVFEYSMLLIGNILFLIRIVRTLGHLRKQAAIIFLSASVPWIGDILYISGNSLYGIDYTPFSFALLGPVFILALFRFRIFDLVAIALRAVFDEMKDPIFVLDTNNILVDCNKAAINFINAPQESLIGSSIEKVFENHIELIRSLHGDASNTRTVVNTSAGITEYYKMEVSEILASEKRIGLVITLQNVTSEQILIRRLRTMATIDELTGINNRRNFMALCQRELDRAKRHQRPIALFMIDIDLFKKVNDNYGHQAGDITLQRVAQSLTKSLRSTDILGRYGGEEFVAALPETDRKTAASIAARLNKSIESLEIQHQDTTISVTISIGTVIVDTWNSEINMEHCLSKADEALYRAKREGRNRVVDYGSI